MKNSKVFSILKHVESALVVEKKKNVQTQRALFFPIPVSSPFLRFTSHSFTFCILSPFVLEYPATEKSTKRFFFSLSSLAVLNVQTDEIINRVE